jgi:hypothetical protein
MLVIILTVYFLSEAYSRQAGSGIAILKVSLVDEETSQPVEKIRFGVRVAESGNDVPLETMRMIKVGEADETKSKAEREGSEADERFPSGDEHKHGSIRVRIDISSTALKLPVLHRWVLLTLDQAFSDFCLECHLQRMQLNLIPRPLKQPASMARTSSKITDTEILCPGLKSLVSFIDSTFSLPHPAFGKTVSVGMILASSVAFVALDLMESFASSLAREAGKSANGAHVAVADISVIRLSRSEQPRLVQLDYSANRKEVIVRERREDGIDSTVSDKPIDCPEYICFYCDQKYAAATGDTLNLPLLFKEVVVDDGNSDRSKAIAQLEKLKQANPRMFYKSFIFIASVKRNRRIFLSYNWHPQVLKR